MDISTAGRLLIAVCFITLVRTAVADFDLNDSDDRNALCDEIFLDPLGIGYVPDVTNNGVLIPTTAVSPWPRCSAG